MTQKNTTELHVRSHGGHYRLLPYRFRNDNEQFYDWILQDCIQPDRSPGTTC